MLFWIMQASATCL